MFKRTKGYILLTMLVLTGLAGRIHTDSLHGKERKLLVTEIKSDRNALLEELNGLSVKQFNFQVQGRSIKKCIQEQINYESNIWLACKNQLLKPLVLSDNHSVTNREFQEMLLSSTIEFEIPSSHFKHFKN